MNSDKILRSEKFIYSGDGLTVLRRSFVRTGTSTTPVWMGFSTVSGETSYMDVSTARCGTGSFGDGRATLIRVHQQSRRIPDEGRCAVILIVTK